MTPFPFRDRFGLQKEIIAVVVAALFQIPSFFPSTLHAETPDSASMSYNCQKGLEKISQRSYDDALYYFGKAAASGMSKDSLCFFCAEAYFYKGVYDTALVFNFGIQAKKSRQMALRKFAQRSAIYSRLGWEKDAQAAQDSLEALPGYRSRFFIPDLSVHAGIDYADRSEREYPSFPYSGRFDEKHYSGPGYQAAPVARWSVPLSGRFLLTAGTAAMVTSMYYRSSSSADSVNVSFSGFSGIEHRPTGIGLTYSLRRVIDYRGDYSTQNSFDLSCLRKTDRMLTFLSSGYEIELEAGLRTQNRKCWMIGYFDGSFATGKGWSLLAIGSGYFAAPILNSLVIPYNIMYVKNTHAAEVIHYRGADTASGVIPRIIFSPHGTITAYEASSPNQITFSFEQRMPQNQIMLNPILMYSLPLPLHSRASIGCNVSMTYYPEKYSWTNVNVEEHSILQYSGMRTVAYNIDEGDYYWVKELSADTSNNWSSFREIYSDSPVDIVTHIRRRIDAAAGLSLSLRRDIWKAGSVMVGADFSYTFSTLKKLKLLDWQITDSDAPVPIPDKSWSVSLTWFYNFNAH